MHTWWFAAPQYGQPTGPLMTQKRRHQRDRHCDRVNGEPPPDIKARGQHAAHSLAVLPYSTAVREYAAADPAVRQRRHCAKCGVRDSVIRVLLVRQAADDNKPDTSQGAERMPARRL
jgi:hypothetical protein